jgi:hypothetical protein
MPLILGADGTGVLSWYVDASFAMHPDMRTHWRRNDHRKGIFFLFGEEKLVAPLIAIPIVDKANGRQEKGKKLN